MNINNKIYKIKDILIRCIFPKRCPLCNEIIPLNSDYCRCSFFDSIKISENFCPHCALEKDNCSCRTANSVYLPEVTAVYVYSGKVRADILNLKFNNEKHLAVKLGNEMAERCAIVYCDKEFDFITFVPMSKSSYAERGYNQSSLLAKHIGKKLFLPVEDVLVKVKSTLPQHVLGGEDRLNNLIDSVTVKDGADIKGKKILICDDVKTTGSTLGQCVKILSENGALSVSCICAAASDYKTLKYN